MSWMNIYWVIHYLLEGVKMTTFSWDLEPNYRVKMTWKMTALLFYFYTEIGMSINAIRNVSLFFFAIFVELCANSDS